VRRLPGLLGSAVNVIWTAGRREFLIVARLQVVAGVTAGVLLLAVHRFVRAIQVGGSDFLPMAGWLRALGGVTLLTAFAGSVHP
jgi:hypothetical protein